jgi:ParB family chromosome partitioning protein
MPPPLTNLSYIAPDHIVRNRDNPRLVFREQEMTELMDSIREVGIKVPISVFQDEGRYVLIDGERRWLCATRLNLKQMPAIIQPKPTRLENILMMFNIHNVRLDWDLMPMARKLGQVQQMLASSGKPHDVKALSAITGVRKPTVERALELLELPSRYQHMLLKEAAKPRAEQHVKPDLFIEIYKSMHAIERYTPEVFEKVTKPQFIDRMVKKYQSGVVTNVVGYRELTRIARAERAGVDRSHAVPTIVRLVKSRNYSIKDAYRDTVQAAYEQRDLVSRVHKLTERLSDYRAGARLDPALKAALGELRDELKRVLT